MKNLENLSKKSFQVNHWMQKHSNSLTPPEFKFKCISSYQDALSRQLSEALWILEEGGLNKKNEFNINELCRLENKTSEKENEKEVYRVKQQEKEDEVKLSQFIAVIKEYREMHKLVPKKCDFSRKRQGARSQATFEPVLKRGRMDFSTPRHVLTGDLVLDTADVSPISSMISSEGDTLQSQDGSTDPQTVACGERKKTNVSDGLDIMLIGNAAKLTESQEGKSLYNLAARVEITHRKFGVLRRGNSEPELACRLEENVFSGKMYGRSLSLPRIGDITLNELSSNPSFTEDIGDGYVSQNVIISPDRGAPDVGVDHIFIKSPKREALDVGGGRRARARSVREARDVGDGRRAQARSVMEAPAENEKMHSEMEALERNASDSEKFIITPGKVVLCAEDIANIQVSPEIDALNLILPVSRKKRILSPEINTPLGRIKKQATTDGSSPILKGRAINWNLHKYVYLDQDTWGGEIDTVATGSNVDNKEPTTREVLTPRRRLNIIGVIDEKPGNHSETREAIDKQPEAGANDVVNKPKKKGKKYHGLCLGKAGKNNGKVPNQTSQKSKKKKGKISTGNVGSKHQTPSSQRLISQFMTPRRKSMNKAGADDYDDDLEPAFDV